jgi:hypothetical protein
MLDILLHFEIISKLFVILLQFRNRKRISDRSRERYEDGDKHTNEKCKHNEYSEGCRKIPPKEGDSYGEHILQRKDDRECTDDETENEGKYHGLNFILTIEFGCSFWSRNGLTHHKESDNPYSNYPIYCHRKKGCPLKNTSRYRA